MSYNGITGYKTARWGLVVSNFLINSIKRGLLIAERMGETVSFSVEQIRVVITPDVVKLGLDNNILPVAPKLIDEDVMRAMDILDEFPDNPVEFKAYSCKISIRVGKERDNDHTGVVFNPGVMSGKENLAVFSEFGQPLVKMDLP